MEGIQLDERQGGLRTRGPQSASRVTGRPLTTTEVKDFLERLPSLDTAVSDAERIDQISVLEAVKPACAGAQATVAVAFDASQREIQAAAGVPARERGRGVGAQVALARRESPARGSRHLGLAKALAGELPHTGQHLRHGRVSEWRATIVTRETACLDTDDRRAVDAALAEDLPTLSDREVEARAKALAVRLDAASVVRRAAKARADRRVWLRPAPDTMTYLTALLPVEQGVAAYAALKAAAGTARTTGRGAAGVLDDDRGGEPDTRSEGQLMADALVERLTGQATAPAVPLEIQLVMPAETLSAVEAHGHGVLGNEPATLPGGQVVPAAFARRLIADCADACEDAGTAVALRRLFTSPDGSQLVAMDSRKRLFNGQLRRFLLARDQACRTPWCEAPVRHTDHVVPDRAGGPTTAVNGQGLCQACNHAKEAPGWSAATLAPGPSLHRPLAPPHRVRTTTPTGHSYDSTAPPVLPTRARTSAGAPTPGTPRPPLGCWHDDAITLPWAERSQLPALLDSA